MSKKNEIVKNESNGALVVDERPAWLDADSHRGSEDVGVKDIILPRIDVLQALSPQIKRNDPKRIEGAEQGMIFNTVSGELYDSEVNIVPIKFTREFIVWKDRDSGGGFAGAFPTEEEANAEVRNQESPELYEVVETHVHFVLLVKADGSTEEAILSLAKSKRKVSRKLNTLVQMVPGDRFGRMYRLSATEVSGPKGEYWSFDISPVGYVSKELYDKGLATYNAITAGERKVDRSYDENGVETDATV